MTTKLPSIARGGVSSTLLLLRPTTQQQQHALRNTIRSLSSTSPQRKEYKLPSTNTETYPKPERAALIEVKGFRPLHPVNPPISTLPPDLILPNREEFSNVFGYYFKLGRTYGKFYLAGVKAVWYNWKAVRELRSTWAQKGRERGNWEELKRSEFQLLARNRHDVGKLPFFGVLVALFGEWLPLLVPFIPSAVPGTCRIPQQIRGMRQKCEERRRESFRRGVKEPAQEVMGGEEEAWGMTKRDKVRMRLARLNGEQLLHLSSVLNVHNRLWERVQLAPPKVLMRSGVSKKLEYLARDDKLLIRDAANVAALSIPEVMIACEERGLDVLGKTSDTLRRELSWWLARQKEEQGRGKAMLTMLFRR